MLEVNKIHQGNALELLKQMPDESVDCVITSPPYYQLRAYKTEPLVWGGDAACVHEWGSEIRNPKFDSRSATEKRAQGATVGTSVNSEHFAKGDCGKFCVYCGAWLGGLGLEPSVVDYVSHLLQIFSGVKRVLKKTGSCWVNIADSYGGSGGRTGHTLETSNLNRLTVGYGATDGNQQFTKGFEKSLLMVPFHFAIGMVAQGWILRNDIVWWKSSCIPASVKDRFTVDWEHLFFFTRSRKYFFEQQFEPLKSGSWEAMPPIGGIKHKEAGQNPTYSGNTPASNILGRNMRCVWNINPEPSTISVCSYCGYFGKVLTISEKEGFFGGKNFSASICEKCGKQSMVQHYAKFPQKLLEVPIRAGCPETVCAKCGKPREKIVEATPCGGTRGIEPFRQQDTNLRDHSGRWDYDGKFVGWTDCGCDHSDGWNKGIVLDPMIGSGTVALVALKLNRNFIGFELSNDYVALANNYIKPWLEQSRLESFVTVQQDAV